MYQVPVATKDDVDAAVANARKAFKDWAKTSFAERAGLLVQYANMIHANRGPLEELLVKEQGKPLGFAHMEVDLALGSLRTFATMEVKDELLDDNDERSITQTFPPLGVCCGIIPWNLPIVLALGKVGPALMTGYSQLSSHMYTLHPR